ncbi:MAG: metallophosphoesterase [Fibromonadales bacterium]|nr:metallophosphoesterase [Fibromonadales bacterium]
MFKKSYISFLAFFALALFACGTGTVSIGTEQAENFETITLQPGSNATEVNFNWYSSKDTDRNKSFVRILSNRTAATVTEGTSESVSATKLRHKATAKGLQQGTSYKYQISNDGVSWSAAYDYKTVPTGAFKFAVVGDPQLSTGNQDQSSIFADKTTAEGWAATVGKIVLEGAYFIVSAGDHVDNFNGNELEYNNLFAPAGLRNLPFAPTMGNHDANCLFAYHFNLPSEQNTKPLDCSSIGGDWSAANSDLGNYFYLYNRVLFVALNTTPYPDASSAQKYVAAFDATIRAAKAANAEKYDWIIVHHHKSTQSVGIHANDQDIQTYVDAGFEKLMTTHGVDLVLAGHDHIFVRTESEGIVYMTVTTASGLKFYPPRITENSPKWPTGIVKWEQNKEPEYTIVEVNGTTMTLTTKTITGKQVDFLTLPKRNL